ncbi:MAG: hypothetical protein ACK5P3_19030, partial [Dolichospermum sp.]
PQNYEKVIDILENFITEFSQQQRDIIHIHEQSLHSQTEYTKTFSQLMQQQYSLLENSETTEHQAKILELIISSSERNMMRFHDHQGDTLRIHEKYLKYHQEYTQNYFQLLQEHFHLLTSEKAAINHVNHPQILSDSAPMGVEKIIPFIKN